jgi:D-glycero-alpha-D-manno-heptose 1-phosphate guanylyltransferase
MPPAPHEMIILTGGLGTRLRGVVNDVPKPLAPVGGRPFLFWLLEGIALRGIRRAVLAVGYRAAQIQAAVGQSFAGLDIVYACEDAPLGTGGAIWAALSLCEGERVFVANGDSWIGVDFMALAAAAPDADIVLTVRPVPDRSRYGSVRSDGTRLLGMDEKTGNGPGLVNAGVYVLRRDLPTRLAMPVAFSFEKEILCAPSAIDVRLHVSDGPFIDIGTPADLAAAQSLIPAWFAAKR